MTSSESTSTLGNDNVDFIDNYFNEVYIQSLKTTRIVLL